MNRRYTTISVIALVLICRDTFGQANVGIGTTNPHPTAVLEVHSPTGTQGLLIPVVDKNTRDGLVSSAADGLLVYDVVMNKFCFFDKANNVWRTLNPLTPSSDTNPASSTHNGNLNVVGTIGATDYAMNLTGNGPVPKGGIIMWSGSTVPAGWQLCDGSGPTPDLRERFIVGAGGNNATVPGTGYVIHQGGGLNTVTIGVSNLPPHSHSYSEWEQLSIDWKSGGNDSDGNGTGGVHASQTDNGPGSSVPLENRPPFYALAFIMKL